MPREARRPHAQDPARGGRIPELFVDDDKLSQEASLLLDRIVRQGRAFGVHALLGSQTLDGAYSLARSTLGQMGVRIALQCTEADSYLILSEENAAARLLTRPGEAIYNDAGGKIEGNNPFQVCWLDDEVRDECLDRIRQRHREQPTARSEPFVFEGNVPADLERCTELQQQLERGTTDRAPVTIDAWLGDAIAIKAPTTANFQTHSGSTLVGQREETVTAMLESMMLAMATQCPHDGLELHVLDALPGDSPQQGRLAAMTSRLPHVTHAGTHRDVEEAMQRLGGLLNARRSAGSTDGPRVMLFTHALHRLRDLRRPEDDFSFSAPDPDATASADAIFAELLKDGPSHGIHVITWVDTLNNLNRTLDRSSQREYEMRVLFQMSANDSSHLIDSPAASALGIQRPLQQRGSGILRSSDRGPSSERLDAICPESEHAGGGSRYLRTAGRLAQLARAFVYTEEVLVRVQYRPLVTRPILTDARHPGKRVPPHRNRRFDTCEAPRPTMHRLSTMLICLLAVRPPGRNCSCCRSIPRSPRRSRRHPTATPSVSRRNLRGAPGSAGQVHHDRGHRRRGGDHRRRRRHGTQQHRDLRLRRVVPHAADQSHLHRRQGTDEHEPRRDHGRRPAREGRLPRLHRLRLP